MFTDRDNQRQAAVVASNVESYLQSLVIVLGKAIARREMDHDAAIAVLLGAAAIFAKDLTETPVELLQARCEVVVPWLEARANDPEQRLN